MARNREFGMDNLRGILILLVVLGHLLENCGSFRGAGFLYRTIYSCHMPAFLFLTGYFARYDARKIIRGLLIPYVLFQTLYIFFDRWLYGEATALQYTTPNWVLWYLVVCILYHILLPLYEVSSMQRQFLALGATFLLSLLAGYDGSVGYRLSLSRFLVFQPWFLLGYYCRKGQWIPAIFQWREKRKVPLALLLTAAVCILVLLMHIIGISPEMLYGANPYETLSYGPLERIFAGITALAWIGFGLLVILPLLQRPLPMLTALGQNTMPVYLLHGFAVRYIQQRQPGMLATPLQVVTVAVLILSALGNPLMGEAFRRLFSGRGTTRRESRTNTGTDRS